MAPPIVFGYFLRPKSDWHEAVLLDNPLRNPIYYLRMKSKSIKKTISQYVAVFEPDSDVGGYTVTIPELPGCVSEGDTFEEAQKNIQEAAQLYLEVLEKNQKRIFKTTIADIL